jgi:AraC-like DNA-binding protein
MSAQGTVSSILARRIVLGAAFRGASSDALLAATGIAAERLEDPNTRVTHNEFLSLWREAARLTGDESFGLHLAEINHRWAGNALFFAMSTSETFDAALACMERYSKLAHDAMVFQRWQRNGWSWVRFAMPKPLEMSRQGVEFALARLALHGQSCLGESFQLHAVHLPHSAPKDVSEHVRVFNCQPVFDQPHAQLAFDASLLSKPLTAHDPELNSLLGHVLNQKLPRGELELNLRDQVEQAVGARLQHGVPDIHDIAKQLHVSARTLQRRLREDGTSFLDVVTRARHTLAERYLRAPEVSLTEIAFLLGFTEPSNFHRAFKRWTGRTPLEARRSALQSA